MMKLWCGLVAAPLLKISMVSAFPAIPFTTSDSSIIDAGGSIFTYTGVNWPGASETMVPEGLQYQSISTIVSRIKELGMNSIRLTYATELIDQIYDNNMIDVPISTAFTNALGIENGTAVFNQVLNNNPSFNAITTRLQVFDAVAAECAQQQIYVHLDNHVSKASWCCNLVDGNGWWNDQYFSPTNWTRGLSYMADHGISWPNLASMSLYNELRPPCSNPTNQALLDSYSWAVWYEQVRRGTDAIHAANPNVLLFLSGLNGDMDLQPVVEGAPLDPSNNTSFFRRDAFAPYQNKLVLELHSYDIVTPVSDCASFNANLFSAGYSATLASSSSSSSSSSGGGGGDNDDDDDDATTTPRVKNRFPVVLSEWGFPQVDSTWRTGTYAQCVQAFLRDNGGGAGWMVWQIGGSYYVREGRQDYDETWGLLTHNWTEWRSPGFVEAGLKPLVGVALGAAVRD